MNSSFSMDNQDDFDYRAEERLADMRWTVDKHSIFALRKHRCENESVFVSEKASGHT